MTTTSGTEKTASDGNGHAAVKLTQAQKDTARRLGMSEGDYAKAADELIRRGKIRTTDII